MQRPFEKLAVGSVAVFLVVGVIAGLAAAFSKVTQLWNFAYLLLGFALLVAALFRVVKERQKRRDSGN